MNNEPLRATLIDSAIALLASDGLEGATLRAVSAAAGRSTTAVFQQFGSKDALILAALREAMERDRAFHAELLASVSGLTLEPEILSDLVVLYVERRAETGGTAHVWQEALFKARQIPDSAALLRDWHGIRREFWTALLTQAAVPRTLAPVLTGYLAIEETYAATLRRRTDYALLLRETVRQLVDGAFGRTDAAAPPGPVTTWLAPEPVPLIELPKETPLSQRLLDLAVRDVLDHGPAELNPRELARSAGISPSMIAYHFGDFARFTHAAIWGAIMRDVPFALSGNLWPGETRLSLARWQEEWERMAEPAKDGEAAGNYVRYARILGQACRLALRRPELLPLVAHFRNIEGLGNFRASRDTWPESLRLNRLAATGFAIWIKGHAILNASLARTARAGRPDDETPLNAGRIFAGIERPHRDRTTVS